MTTMASCADAGEEARIVEAAGTATTASTVSSLDGPSTASHSCVETYSAETLRNRAFAFDGTLQEIGANSDRRAPDDDPIARVGTFRVHKWFAGGGGDTVTVAMQRQAEAGQRLLVAGEPRWGGEPLDHAVAWECGFTVGYSEGLAQEWEAAFG